MPSSNCSNREQEFSDILSEVSSINDIYSDASLILGGDFNFDYIRTRDSGIVDKLGQFNTNNRTVNCRELPNINSEIHYIYESKANQARSVIDHFLVSESVMADVATLEVLSDAKNFLDHLPVVLQIRTNASHKISLPDNICQKLQWKKATEMELSNYRNVLDKKLSSVCIPWACFTCFNCASDKHKNAIEKLHDDIISCCFSAAEETISLSGNNDKKSRNSIPGWTTYVESSYKQAKFWHKIWKENGSPRNGVIADIRRKTRSQYHYTVKYVRNNADTILSNKMAEALLCSNINEF